MVAGARGCLVDRARRGGVLVELYRDPGTAGGKFDAAYTWYGAEGAGEAFDVGKCERGGELESVLHDDSFRYVGEG
jgi:hypothetical protein